MAKVKLYCDSGANIHSCREEIIDTVVDFGMEEGEWEALSDDEKWGEANQWAQDRLDIGYEEL
jgi:hypothetical protein